MGDDWDLQAVIRGFAPETYNCEPGRDSEDPFPFLSSLLVREDPGDENDQLCLPDLFSTQTVLQELENLCKPFIPTAQNPSQQNVSSSASIPNTCQKDRQQNPKQSSSSAKVTAHSQAARSKRRKIQLKRVVKEVPAVEGLSCDMWAWRKYGQKPIKGSPYPRGYYRCSSSKGCPARKQVERNRFDPSKLIITYTSEHNHPMPTHRNSLAGSTRHKPEMKSSLNHQDTVDSHETESQSPSTEDPNFSDVGGDEEFEEDESLATNKILEDEMLVDLEDIHAYLEDQKHLPTTSSTSWLSASTNTASARECQLLHHY